MKKHGMSVVNPVQKYVYCHEPGLEDPQGPF